MDIRWKIRLRWALAIGLGLFACEQIYRHGREYVVAEELATVEPGKIYRGAWQRDWPMRRVIRDHDIKTIVALAHPPTHPLVTQEKALAKELGVALDSYSDRRCAKSFRPKRFRPCGNGRRRRGRPGESACLLSLPPRHQSGVDDPDGVPHDLLRLDA